MNTFYPKLKTLFEHKKQYFFLIIGLFGVFMILISELPGQESVKKDAGSLENLELSEEYKKSLEKDLETILAEIDGAGKVRVLITLKSSGEKFYAKDQKSNSREKQDSKESNIDSKYVRSNQKDHENGILLKKNVPQIKGVVVVCEGGNNSKIITDISNAVCAALELSPNEVSILKMKKQEETHGKKIFS